MTNCNTNGESSSNGTRPRLQNIININSGNTNPIPTGSHGHTHTESNSLITALQTALTALQTSTSSNTATLVDHASTLDDHVNVIADHGTRLTNIDNQINTLTSDFFIFETSYQHLDNNLLQSYKDASFGNTEINGNFSVSLDNNPIFTIDKTTDGSNQIFVSADIIPTGAFRLGTSTKPFDEIHVLGQSVFLYETTISGITSSHIQHANGAFTIERDGDYPSNTIFNVSGGHAQLEGVSLIDLEISNNLNVQGKTVLGTHTCSKDKNILEIGGGGTVVDLTCASIPSYIENFNILELDYSGNLTVLGDISSVNVTNMQFDICNLYQLISNISNLDISFVVDISNFDIDISNLSSAIYDLSSVVSLHDSSLASLQQQIGSLNSVDLSLISDLSSRVLTLETNFYNLDLSYATDVSLQELLTLGSDASFNNVGVNNNLNVDGTLTVYGDIVPSISGGSSLGSASKPFGDLHVAGSTIYMHNTDWSFTTISQTGNTVIMSDNLTVLGDLSNIRLTNFDTSLDNIASTVSTLDTSFGIIQAQIITLSGLDSLDISNLTSVINHLSLTLNI